mmetsp:Transcript_1607/g.2593  ORF Transcript_1607/g.2593 Transcript_1607/m.2593 type:complete len:171 (-) Transcript_1607:30-542(-)
MKLSVVVVLALVSVSFGKGITFTEFFRLQANETNAVDFYKGLNFGLQKDESNPDKCYQRTKILVNDFEAVWNDVAAIANGSQSAKQQLYTDAEKYSADFVSSESVCNWMGFVDALNKVLNGGLTDLIWRYIDNSSKIGSEIDTIKSCSNNYFNCGKAVGELVKFLLDWSI